MFSARFAILAALVVASPSIARAEQAFEWPQANADAMPDARLGSAIEDARQAARQGADRAWEARKASMQSTVRNSLRGSIGFGGKPTIIAAGTVMQAVPYNGESGPMLGTISYANGAKMTGVFGPDLGIYRASFTSSIAEFAGRCYGATTSNPQPTDGEYRFRSGDTFVGTRADDDYQGIYESADHSRKFIGVMRLNTASPRPVRGIMQDDHGHLLAVVGGAD